MRSDKDLMRYQAAESRVGIGNQRARRHDRGLGTAAADPAGAVKTNRRTMRGYGA
ncbi:hypothetical protein LB516_12820 [Mesorhizobium sp. CO1-1-7]|nr:hypothetical protein [Mesorhizobium sp. CO1-1-7]MBZ9746134.1 hypothetical protein [Mesorhizobium sp. CO1-1-7]